jgi:hypothetical protein
MVLRLVPRLVALAVAAVVSTTLLSAQDPYDGEIEVAQVRFETVRGPQGASWYVAAIELGIKPGPANSSRHVSRVQVGLIVAFEATVGLERRWEVYQAEATAVALPQGRAVLRFYLPPEIVQRDRLAGEPRYYLIDLGVAGRSLALRRAQVSSNLPNPEAVARFRERAAASLERNRGILRPQALTPFAHAADGPAAPTLLIPP